jgi:hypothetical protein
MRKLVLTFAASLFIAACGGSSGGGGKSAVASTTATTVSCVWRADTCDQYTGGIDATFSTNLQITCAEHGTTFAAGTCPSANQVGHCDLGTTAGIANSYYYYSPTYDAASAKADCLGHGVGASWVP